MKVTYNSDMIAGQFRRRMTIGVFFFAALLFLSASFMPSKVYAQQLQLRSLNVLDVTAGATTTHSFKFSYASTGTAVGSLMFEYCTSPLQQVTCVSPPGMNASGAVLSQQIGEGGYFILTAQSNRIILTRAPALPPTFNPSQYIFTHIKNPTGPPGPFYVRITTYGSTDATGSNIDFGAVVNATTQGVNINSEVPPYLKFCIGVTITGDCSTAQGNLVDLGDLTAAKASSGTSQMLVATNAGSGMIIGMYGTTMTSGNNTIGALDNPTVSAPGTAQFGLNLRANSNPSVGQDPSGGSSVPTPNYNIPNRYTFRTGDTVAASANVTDTTKFTSSYIVNIPASQPPGVYTATLTYICTASF